MPFRRDELNEDLKTLRDHPELRARWDVYWTLEDDAFEAWAKTGLALAESSMKKLVDLCREHGIEMTVAIYPWPAQILHADLESRQVSFWRKFAADHDLGFIDLFPLFVGTSDPPDAVYRRYYINGDIHWSAEGHRAVAEAVLEAADFSRREPRDQSRHQAP